MRKQWPLSQIFAYSAQIASSINEILDSLLCTIYFIRIERHHWAILVWSYTAWKQDQVLPVQWFIDHTTMQRSRHMDSFQRSCQNIRPPGNTWLPLGNCYVNLVGNGTQTIMFGWRFTPNLLPNTSLAALLKKKKNYSSSNKNKPLPTSRHSILSNWKLWLLCSTIPHDLLLIQSITEITKTDNHTFLPGKSWNGWVKFLCCCDKGEKQFLCKEEFIRRLLLDCSKGQ